MIESNVDIVSIFSGSGGFDLGIQSYLPNSKIVFANDIREHSSDTFSNNFNLQKFNLSEFISNEDPDSKICVQGDVRKIPTTKLNEISADILIGGDRTIYRKNGRGDD